MASPTRREFCQQAILLGVGSYAALQTACHLPSLHRGSTSKTPSEPLHTLSETEFVTLSAVCERLLPGDQDPGAIELGVPIYIDRMLESPELKGIRAMMHDELRTLALETKARTKGKTFAEMAAEEQDKMLSAWQHGPVGSRHFFDILLSLCLEGAFGDPKYGGNSDGRGFAMIGFSPGPVFKKMAPMAKPTSSAPAALPDAQAHPMAPK